MTDPGPILKPPSLIRRHVATNTTDDPGALIGLACDESVAVRREAARNPATPRWVLDLLVRAGADHELRGRRRPDPDMTTAELRKLVECGPWAQELVADHPNTGEDVLAVLARQPSRLIRMSVASHPNVAPATLALLCADAEVEVRQRANQHAARPGDAFAVLRQVGAAPDLAGLDPDPPFDRPAVAVLRAAAELGSWGGFLAARHEACPGDVLKVVATSADWRVRSGILDNPAASDDLVALAADIDGLDEERSMVQMLRLLSDPTSTSAELALLLDDSKPVVRLAIARHPGADAKLLGRLASDESAEIRSIAARHPLTDPAAIDLLVRAGSSPDLMRLAEPDPTLSPTELDGLLGGGRWAKQLAVRHPNTSPNALARLLCDDDGKIREWAATHASRPVDVIVDLRRAGAATDFQGIAVADPTMPADDLRRIAALGPWGALVVSWHPNAPADLARPPT